MLAMLSGCATGVLAANSWQVLPEHPDRSRLLIEHLRERVAVASDSRLEALERLNTPDQIHARQDALRAGFLANLGEHETGKTPLNARVVGVIQGEGYTVEKVVYESRRQFFVTANFYRPEGAGPFPAVLIPCGHTANGKAGYQKAGLLLARNGIAALIYDPIGQGGRCQILTRDDGGNVGAVGRFRSTVEHTLTGVAPISLGQSLATYRIHDGIRSLDYLVSRSDVDAGRIGCTGNSGGGLMTSYLMALDDRILAAAPGCYITTKRIKTDRPGPGDAEQNVFRQISFGPDHPDFLLMRAPRPTLILAATKDFVPIEGTWDAFRQAKRVYTKLGFPERVDLVEADEKHGFTRPLRVAMTRFMRRWLLGLDDAVEEWELPEHSDEELRCTASGQVLLLPGARSVFDLYRERAEQLRRNRFAPVSSGDVQRLLSFDKTDAPTLTSDGVDSWRGHRVKRLIVRGEDGFPVPLLRVEPPEATGAPVLLVDGRGKAAELREGGLVDSLIAAGRPVVTADLRGYGETAAKAWRFAEEYFGVNAAEFFVAYQLGDSLAALRARDLLAVVSVFPGEEFELRAIGAATVPALHAAAAMPGRFMKIVLTGGMRSWHEAIDVEVTRGILENLIHGALVRYDLPDLVDVAGREKFVFENLID